MISFELRSQTLCAQWTYRATPARLLIRFPSISHVTGLCTCISPFPFHMFPCVTPFGLTTRLSVLVSFLLTLCRYALLLWIHDLSVDSLFLDLWLVYDSFPFYELFVHVSRSLVVLYIYGWRWGFVPHLQSTLQPP